jgi:hypothetical protein
MEITRNHILFWDAQKLAEAHAELANSPARAKLSILYLASPKVRRLVWTKEAPALPAGPSVHQLIPNCTRNDSIFHRSAFGRKKNREIRGKDHHLMGNLGNFVAGKVRRGETFEAALLHFCYRQNLAGHQPYEKFARRWARKLNIDTGVDYAGEFAEYGRRDVNGRRRP